MKFNKLAGYGVDGEDRQCGRSLSIALGSISKALANPGVEIYVTDHHPSPTADRSLFLTVRHLCDQMGLQYIDFYHPTRSIKFDLYSEVDGPNRVLHEGKILQKVDTAPTRYYLDGYVYE